jgi:hypothetical protein
MDGLIVGLIAWVIPAFVLFVIIYYAVRLAIRHEREADRRRHPPA